MALDGSHHTTSSGCGAGGVGGGGGCSKMERKEVEKNRRLHMKGLCLKLSSLVPAHHLRHYSSSSSSPPSSNKDAATQLDQLDSAAAYIKQLRGRIDDLKRRKQAALSGGTAGCSSSVSAGDYKAQTTSLPVIEVRHHDGTLDVALVSEVGRPFRLHEVIAVLEQEGAEVVSASFSLVGDKIFYTVHSQALCPRIGLDARRVAHMLRGLAAVSTLLT